MATKMYKGANQITKMYKGDKEIKRLYLGTRIVYEPEGIVEPPSGMKIMNESSIPNGHMNNPIKAGVKFTVVKPGTLTEIGYYVDNAETQNVTLELWNNADVKVENISFDANTVTADGWVYVTLATPLHLTAGQHFTVSRWFNGGQYRKYWTETKPISAIPDSITYASSVYNYQNSFPYAVDNTNFHAFTGVWVDD